MKTTFEDWKRQLRRAGRLLPDGRITIDRGLPFYYGFIVGGDWTGATLAVSLKNNPDDTDSVLDFTTAVLAYDSTFEFDDGTVGGTPFTVTATAVQTAALAADGDGDFLVPFAIDFVLTFGGSPFRLMGGEAVLAGQVTDA